MSHCQDFIWRPFILMHMCIGVVIVTCSVHMFCFGVFFTCGCAFACQVAMPLKKDGARTV